MFGDINSYEIYGETSDIFGRLKFQLPQNLPSQAKTYAASRASNIELLMLVSNFKTNSRLDNTQRYFSRMHGIPSMRNNRKRKKRTDSVHLG